MHGQLTSLVFPALTQGITERDRKEYEEKRTSIYRKYLSGKKQEILNEKDREEYLLNDFYPPLSVALQFAFTKKHLWEKQKSDSDFLNIRIGTGDFPMIAKKTFPERKFELESDHLTEEMYALAEETVFLNNVPIMLSLLLRNIYDICLTTGTIAGIFVFLPLPLLTHFKSVSI